MLDSLASAMPDDETARTPQPVISKCREEISRPPDPRKPASSAPHCDTLHHIGLAIDVALCCKGAFREVPIAKMPRAGLAVVAASQAFRLQ